MSLRTFRPFFSNLEFPAASPSLWQPPSSLFDNFSPATAASFPPVSIEEKENGYEIIADLPGIKKEELKVSLGDQNRRLILEGNVVRKESTTPSGTIKEVEGGEKGEEGTVAKQNNGEKGLVKSAGRNFLVDERVLRQSFHRAFHFATPLDPKTLKAKLEEGMLKLTVEKQAQDAGVSVVNIE
ncbi:hypothetical protein BDY24DRAFT_379545 [Mrakia frigida]|uniref:Hsp20/alpha crystallin family protein n=1 Tax=Mrakia frigida TaxID=29902 RepID=UPI003FCC1856